MASNRYPANLARRDYRRPTPKPRWYPTPDNDNTPGRRPRPKPWIPANDNRPVPTPAEWAVPKQPRVPGYRKFLRRALHALPLINAGYVVWNLLNGPPRIDPAAYGFTLVCRVPGPIDIWTWATGNSSNTCAVPNQSTAGGSSPENFVIPARNNPNPGTVRRDTIRGYITTGSNRGTQLEEWTRAIRYGVSYPPGYPVPDEEPFPWPRFPLEVWPDPWIDPFIPPGYPPLPEPRARPRPRPLQPTPRLPEDRVSEEPRYPPRPEFRPRPEPEPLPRRPRKYERERKIRIKDIPNKRLRRVLGWLISAASEAGDFLDILYDALPDSLTNSDADTAEKFETVFKNLDKVDFDEFVSELWQNEVQDRYFGKGFGDMTSALEEFGLELPSLKL